MNDQKPGQQPAPQNTKQYLEALRLRRAAALIAQVPTEYGIGPARAWMAWAQIVAQLCGKKTLARVVPPWISSFNRDPKRPPYKSAGRWRRELRAKAPKVARGRASNPTARIAA